MKLSCSQINKLKELLWHLKFEVDESTFCYIEQIVLQAEDKMIITYDEINDILRVISISCYDKSKVELLEDTRNKRCELSDEYDKRIKNMFYINHELINNQYGENMNKFLNFLSNVLCYSKKHINTKSRKR